MLNRLYAQSVTTLRAPVVNDKYGQPNADWAHAAETVISGISWQPDTNFTTSFEGVGDRTEVAYGWKLSTPRGRDIDLLPTDRIRADGIVYEVEGEVARFFLGGAVHHVEAHVRRVEG